ncbi:MAG: hypothetical protein H7A35_01825 [Planctomycetales bacterium]|nr:hypothetical protein [bacterium]UNM08797.1 MAG: hypothetical protein H7A35_01825 [Planctomycetales bacterium]
MDIAARQILQRMEQLLHQSQRNMRLYFAIGGGLLATGLFNGLPIEMYMISTLAQMLIFLLGSIIGMACGSKLQKSVLPVAIEHVRSLLIDAMLMAQLIDSPAHELPGNSRGLLNSGGSKENTSMGGRLDWIVNNWSVLAHRMGYHPLPQLMQRLHLLYLALIVLVPLSAVLLHSVSLLLVLGSVYVLGLSLDSLECDAVRTVLLDSLLADEE